MVFFLFAAFSLAISGLSFDSYWVKMLPVPYPVIFLFLGLFTAILILTPINRSRLSEQSVILVFFIFVIFLLISVTSSLMTGAGDILALGMKVSTLVVNFLFFYTGILLFHNKNKMFFARTFFFFSLVGSVFFYIFMPDKFNPNWLGITLVFSILILILSESRQRLLYSSFLFLFSFIYCYFLLSSRGAAAASLLSAFFLFFMALIFRRLELFIYRVSGFVLIFSTIFVSVIGVYIYNSKFYPNLVALSIKNTGKSLDSSRLERWDMGAQFFLERPVMGWGIDAHIARVSNSTEYGDLHNFWWEVLFRGGLLGGLCFLFLFLFIVFKIVKNNPKAEDVVAFLIIFIFMSVYALGGVTHWPGAYMFWLVLGMLLGRATLKYKNRNVVS